MGRRRDLVMENSLPAQLLARMGKEEGGGSHQEYVVPRSIPMTVPTSAFSSSSARAPAAKHAAAAKMANFMTGQWSRTRFYSVKICGCKGPNRYRD